MKRTEGGPQVESKDFRYGVNGFPKARGLYRRGDNGAIQPDRFYRAWNVQFNGDEVTERGGQSEFSDTSEGCPIIGLYSSNMSWNPGDPSDSTDKNAQLPRLQWAEPVVPDPLTYPGGKFSEDTGYKPDLGLFTVTGFDPGPFTGGGGWGAVTFANDSFIPGYSHGTLVKYQWDSTTMDLASMVRHGNKVAISLWDNAAGATQKILLRAPLTTAASIYENTSTDPDYTDITDAGITPRSRTTLLTAAAATEVNIGALLFSYNGDLYALYRRFDGTPQGLLRKWSGSGTTWSTVGTFPTMTAKLDPDGAPAPANWRGWVWGNHPWAWAVWEGSVYIPVWRTNDDSTDPNFTNENFNNLSVLKFDGTAITEFYNYALTAGKRSSGGSAGCYQLLWESGVTATGSTLVPPSYSGYNLQVVVMGGRLFVNFLGQWYGQPASSNVQYPWSSLIFDSGGTLYGDTITTPNLLAVQGSYRPTLPTDTSAYPSASYPNWNNAPWVRTIRIGGVYYGMPALAGVVGSGGFTSGRGMVDEDTRCWMYRSLDGLAWYKDFEFTTASDTDTYQWYIQEDRFTYVVAEG